MTCPSCGAAAPAGSRFCPSCGHALGTRGDERRVVSVLFADLVGYTTLSESRDPEQVKNVVDASFARLATDVTAHGGRVDKIVGDALVALFGAPLAHEDDAERAVRAALQMQRTVSALADEFDLPIRLRVGVNTGEVLVGAIRAGGDYTAMGDVVNVASRLQTLAEPGTVVVGHGTHDCTKEIFDYQSLGHLTARGREETVEAWVARSALAPPGRRPRKRRSPLVGRESELALLRSCLDTTVTRNRAHVVVLLGEAGLGKSRLAEEIADVARNDYSALVLEGRCVPYGEANVWWPIAEMVRQACGIDTDDEAKAVIDRLRSNVVDVTGLRADDAEVDRLSSGLAYVLGDAEALSDVDPTRAPAEVRRAVQALVQGLARRQPLVVALAELHWAEDDVLALVDDLLERAVGLPVLLLATARPEFEPRWAPKPGRHNAVTLHLDPLDADAITQLLAALLESEPDAALRGLLLERSGGNPLFLEELVALLADAPNETGARDLPATLRGLVAARIDSLDPSARDSLEDAAVVGHDGRVDALVALAEARGELLAEEVVDELVSRDLLTEDAGAWSFRSELVREVAYDTLTKAERARRHAALGLWLAERRKHQNRDDELEPIAHHLGVAASLSIELGGVAGVPADICPRALRAIERSAMRSKQRGLHSGSVRLLDRALELLAPDDIGNRHRVLLARASAHASLRDNDAAATDIDAVLAETATDDRVTRAQALTIRGQLLQARNQLHDSAAVIEEALALWRSVGDANGEAGALRLAGMTQLFLGNNDDADALFTEALGAFRSAGDRQGEAWVLQNRAWLSFNQGNLDEADERLAAAAEMFHEIGDFGGLGWVNGLLGFVRLFQGRFEEAGALAEHILANERDQNDLWAQGMISTLLASVRLFTGRPDEALVPAREAAALFGAINDAERVLQARVTEARCLVNLGRIDEALDLIGDAHQIRGASSIGLGVVSGAIAIQIGEPGMARSALANVDLSVLMGLGTLTNQEEHVIASMAELMSGSSGLAVEALHMAVASAANEGQVAYANACLALALAAAGDPEGALAAAERVDKADGGTYLDRIAAAQGRGLALVRLGRSEDARSALDAAVELVGATNDVLSLAVTRLARAEAAQVLGDHDAKARQADADAAIRALGVPMPGWYTVFGLASGRLEHESAF
ncbi:MAG TPA: adenylate/guanylate cyclase domain-containing protein [Acidimicrobiales bacterium]|nr:adenylate/guanylate cyclase domain-containing protein [Acidimicrobiales bacterium]